MKLFLISLLILFFPAFKSSAQQAPDISKLQNLSEKIEAWRNYCNLLLTETFEYKKLIVEAKKGLAMLPADSIKQRSMFSLFAGCAYENTKQYDSAVYFLNQCVSLARQANRTTYELTALSRLNYVYDYTRNVAARKATINRMVQIADTSKKPEIRELAAGALGGYFADINDYENAIKYKIKQIDLGKEALRTDTLTNDPINIGYNMNNVANLFNEMGQPQKALDYLNEARPYIGDRALKGNEETYYTYFINAFLALKNKDSARFYYNLTYAGMKGRDTLYNTLSDDNYLFADYFFTQEKTDSSLYYALESRRTGLLSPNKSAYIRSCQMLGKIYYTQGKYREALGQMNIALQNDFEFDRQAYANIQKTMARSYAKLNKWDSAYMHYNIYSDLNDSLQASYANKNFADAEAIYQNKEKKQQIVIKNAALGAARKERIWLISGLVLLGLVAFLLIFIYRNKKTTADLLDGKNKNLSVLNTQLEEANQTKAKLFSIISHDLRSPISQVYQFLKLQQLNPRALSDIQKEELSNKIQTATGSLLETMEDLLLWSKTQMSAFNTSLQEVELLALVDRSLQLLELNIEAKQITMINTVDPKQVVKTDPYFLQTILRNLLQNAVKASPAGETIKLSSTKQDNIIFLQLENKGETFTQENYEAALQEASQSTNLNGLGLRLVKELSEKSGIVVRFLPALAGTITQLEIPCV